MSNTLGKELVKQCLAGDRLAFGELLRKYEKPVYNVAYRIVGNLDDAADITQTVFLKAFEKLDTYNPKHRFFSWIYRIAINEAINQNRILQRQQPIEGNEPMAPGGPESECEASDLSDRIQGSLMQLNENYRSVIALRHFAGLSYSEISDALDVPEKTIKSRLYSARQLMKADLIKGGDAC